MIRGHNERQEKKDGIDKRAKARLLLSNKKLSLTLITGFDCAKSEQRGSLLYIWPPSKRHTQRPLIKYQSTGGCWAKKS